MCVLFSTYTQCYYCFSSIWIWIIYKKLWQNLIIACYRHCFLSYFTCHEWKMLTNLRMEESIITCHNTTVTYFTFFTSFYIRNYERFCCVFFKYMSLQIEAHKAKGKVFYAWPGASHWRIYYHKCVVNYQLLVVMLYWSSQMGSSQLQSTTACYWKLHQTRTGRYSLPYTRQYPLSSTYCTVQMRATNAQDLLQQPVREYASLGNTM